MLHFRDVITDRHDAIHRFHRLHCLGCQLHAAAREAAHAAALAACHNAGGGVPDVPFASSYKPGEISALWNSLKKCYGNEELARQAVAQNDQVLCPIYATPAMLSDSKKALVDIFGKDEALQIMSKSPMILTCGSELRSLKPDDIRSTANTRQFLDAFKGPAVLALPLGLIFILKALGGVVEAYS